jgi:pantetheine-phosphate adenylyltransferase
MSRSIAIYPGTFDPITNGHVDVIHRATEIFPRVVVLVAKNPSKQPLFNAEERADMIRKTFARDRRVEVDTFDGLLVDYVSQRKAKAIIRGLRAVSDFEYEFQMALTNRKLAPSIDTIFLVPDEKYTYLNSTIVREVARLGGDISKFVPPLVRTRLTARLSGKR